jgi:acetylornithine deacetylase/succinyl-diaminopimelate desuccinylase-like protein
VIPPEAWANLDVRLLPGEDPAQFLESLRRVVNDPNVTIEPQSPEIRPANSSPTDTALYKAIRQVSAHYFPGTPVVPRLDSGYTESQRYRTLGINSYGFNPYTATEEENNSEHGDNERIRVEEIRRGFRVLYDVVTSLAGEG